MLKGIKIIVLVLITTTICSGQKKALKKDLYAESLWSIIDFANPNETPVPSDTMLVICTNRKFDSTTNPAFKYEPDSSGGLRYILALRNRGRWKLYHMPSMKDAASYLDIQKDVVFYIEGMGKTFTTNLYRAAGLSLQYNINVIVFDYPSVYPGHSLIRNFNTAKRNSTKAYSSYSLFLKEIQENKNAKEKWIYEKRTTVFQHSMGARMLKEAVVMNSLSKIQPGLVNRLVLNAPCVNQKRHSQWFEKINFAEQIIVHYNSQDLQLKGASVMTFRRQLGAKIKKPYAGNVHYVHFNELAGRQHSIFLNRPGGPDIPAKAHAYYKMLFHEPSIDWQNSLLFRSEKKRPGVSLLP